MDPRLSLVAVASSELSGCIRRFTSMFLAREPDEGMVIYFGKFLTSHFALDIGVVITKNIDHHSEY